MKHELRGRRRATEEAVSTGEPPRRADHTGCADREDRGRSRLGPHANAAGLAPELGGRGEPLPRVAEAPIPQTCRSARPAAAPYLNRPWSAWDVSPWASLYPLIRAFRCHLLAGAVPFLKYSPCWSLHVQANKPCWFFVCYSSIYFLPPQGENHQEEGLPCSGYVPRAWNGTHFF